MPPKIPVVHDEGMRRSDRIFWLSVLALILVAGALLNFSSLKLANIGYEHRDAFLTRVKAIYPNQPTEKADSVESALTLMSNTLSDESWKVAFIRDLSFALIIAVVLTVGFEYFSRVRFQEQLTRGVLESVMRRFIPEDTYESVKNHVFRARTFRRNYRLDMVVRDNIARDDPNATTFGPYVSDTKLSYRIENLTKSSVIERFTFQLNQALPVNDSEGPLPRFRRIQVGPELFEGKALEAKLSEDGKTFSVDRPVPKEGFNVVCMIVEAIRVPDTFVWTTRTLSDGFTVSIQCTSPAIDFSVFALHPDADDLDEGAGTWEFKQPMLPYQGFRVITTPKNLPAPIQVSTVPPLPENPGGNVEKP